MTPTTDQLKDLLAKVTPVNENAMPWMARLWNTP